MSKNWSNKETFNSYCEPTIFSIQQGITVNFFFLRFQQEMKTTFFFKVILNNNTFKGNDGGLGWWWRRISFLKIAKRRGFTKEETVSLKSHKTTEITIFSLNGLQTNKIIIKLLFFEKRKIQQTHYKANHHKGRTRHVINFFWSLVQSSVA